MISTTTHGEKTPQECGEFRLPLLVAAVTLLLFTPACSDAGDGSGGGSSSGGYQSGLVLTNTVDLNASGPPGGPFAPSGSYTLSNQGTQALNWSITASDPWIQISSSFGFLQAGESVVVDVTAGGSGATSLPIGSYVGTVTLRDTNDSSTNSIRPATLAIEDSGASGFAVTPTISFGASGEQGGPFSPDNMTYTVTNTSTGDVDWSVAVSDTFVFVVGLTSGTLAAGESTDVLLQHDPNITSTLGLGLHTATATFSSAGQVAAVRNVALSVQGTVNGWTDLTPSADSRLIYVSSSLGNDANDGLSPATPKSTVAAGLALLRDGFPDHCLLRRGDTWSAGFTIPAVSGRSAAERMVIGAYGDESLPRPRFTGYGGRYITTTQGSFPSFIAVVSLEIDGSARNGNGSSVGIWWADPGRDNLLEDIYVHHHSTNMAFWCYAGQPLQNMTIRRCAITDSFRLDSHAQGIFVDTSTGAPIDGLTFEECLVDHNGWNESVSGAEQNVFNHNFYIQPAIQNVTLRGNVIANGAATGAQMRGGGNCERNIFVRNPIALDWGMVTGASNPVTGGVTGQIIENVILEGNDIGFSSRGGGLNVANVGSGLIADNLFAHYASAQPNGVAIGMTGDIQGETDYGISNVIIENNLVYDWASPLTWPLGTAGNEFQNITVRGNNFQNPVIFTNAFALVRHDGGTLPSGFTYDSNTYYSASNSGQWFYNGGTSYSTAGWMAISGETNATGLSSLSSFADPNRDMRTYRDLVESTSGSSLDSVLVELRQQRRGNWRPEYETLAIINYIRAGFDLPPLQ